MPIAHQQNKFSIADCSHSNLHGQLDARSWTEFKNNIVTVIVTVVICHLLITIHINHIKLIHSELHGLPDGQNSHRIGEPRTGFKHCGEQQKVLPSTS